MAGWSPLRLRGVAAAASRVSASTERLATCVDSTTYDKGRLVDGLRLHYAASARRRIRAPHAAETGAPCFQHSSMSRDMQGGGLRLSKLILLQTHQ